MNNINYKSKYLKYKSKYLNLLKKTMIGGALEPLKSHDKIHYIFMDYNDSDNSTHFELPEYTTRIRKFIHPDIKEISLYVTNEANKILSSIGGGTTGAVKTIGDKYFQPTCKIDPDETVIRNLYELMKKQTNGETEINEQLLKIPEKKPNPVGTVILSTPSNPFKRDIVTYTGVFHINGFNFRGAIGSFHKNTAEDDNNFEKSSEYKNLVTNYYRNIVNYLLIKNTSPCVLHLAQIPGENYCGKGDIVRECIVKAINDVIDSKREINYDLVIVLPTKCNVTTTPKHQCDTSKSSDNKCYLDGIANPFYGAGIIVVENAYANRRFAGMRYEPAVILFAERPKKGSDKEMFSDVGGGFDLTDNDLETSASREAREESLDIIQVANQELLSKAYYCDVKYSDDPKFGNDLYRTYFICLENDIIKINDFLSNKLIIDNSILGPEWKESNLLLKFYVSDLRSATNAENVLGSDGNLHALYPRTFNSIKQMLSENKLEEILSNILRSTRIDNDNVQEVKLISNKI